MICRQISDTYIILKALFFNTCYSKVIEYILSKHPYNYSLNMLNMCTFHRRSIISSETYYN